ncbi:Hypothetical protein PAU_02292 [Photorhabdus asymbiotica]|uniref:Uncharacterized protein n=2 Tax=Photorhabdus asymbiotica TaxID=291112 RepID=B6VKW0_PHOAA|nr:hypothetical protein BDD30_3898 [Photorhabdus asymbiotica]CAQ84384.1 Hypothetical protein PAU_02292 [Photorhabdus asymbiotica]CAR66790.1 Hypothetical protein PA-RVA5-3188 [Photorhabdus asymbiotica subsp. asymbiotica ATCC 43949]
MMFVLDTNVVSELRNVIDFELTGVPILNPWV